jgi:4-hydroxy-2-oxoheptanedioate aldolase
LFSDVDSVEDVKAAVKSVRPDTPEDKGHFGAVMRRFSYMGYGGGTDYVQALNDIVVVLMIEKKSAVDNLEEILSVGGVDMIQWGGTDYSMNVGKAGQRRTPEIDKVERQVFETAVKMGVPPRAEIGSVDQAKYFMDMGVKHFCIGTDIAILFSWWKENGEGLRKVVESA